jgi:pyruvate/2-oxoglutarate dehydrogenase complex dihydrolipoamide acyltransferase (E2) component
MTSLNLANLPARRSRRTGWPNYSLDRAPRRNSSHGRARKRIGKKNERRTFCCCIVHSTFFDALRSAVDEQANKDSPKARRLASERGLNLSDIAGSGADGEILASGESKQSTSWINQNSAYETAVSSFVSALLTPGKKSHFLSDFVPFQRQVARIAAGESRGRSNQVVPDLENAVLAPRVARHFSAG